MLNKSKEEELTKTIVDNKQILEDLNSTYRRELEARTKEINDLLPGATSAGLASAFADRKKAIEENKGRWANLTILSSVLLVLFGFVSLFPSESKFGLESSVAGRSIVIAGLILLEEFARRNFNIISRLAESYAYKEALAKSYTGYKKQMEQVSMPSDDPHADIKGDSVLVKTFLDKLQDEPGKHVFDKEKQTIGAGMLMDRMMPQPSENGTDASMKELCRGTLLAKISWPIVVIVAILATAGCIIAYLLKSQIA